MRIVVMGQGYVGLPLAMAALDAGHHVIGYEPDEARCLNLKAGISYVEDVASSRIERGLGSGNYEPTLDASDLVGWDIAVITVPTPLKDRLPDLSYIENAAQLLAARLEAGRDQTVVLESTTHPGTTRGVLIPILERVSGLQAGKDFSVGFSPERIDPGNETWTFSNTPKVVSGLTDQCATKVRRFYETVTEVACSAKSLESAELAKVLENTFRHVNIALVNEMSRFAYTLGIDLWDALDLAETKPFGFMKFTPGPGVGGHCLPVDPVYLSHHVKTTLGESFRFVELAQDINEQQPAYVMRRLQDGLNERGIALRGAHVVALGLAYKPGTADVRESPAWAVVDLLRAKGAKVSVVDPHAASGHAEVYASMDSVDSKNADAVVVLTAHAEFDLHQVAEKAAYVLDTRGVVPLHGNVERI